MKKIRYTVVEYRQKLSHLEEGSQKIVRWRFYYFFPILIIIDIDFVDHEVW